MSSSILARSSAEMSLGAKVPPVIRTSALTPTNPQGSSTFRKAMFSNGRVFLAYMRDESRGEFHSGRHHRSSTFRFRTSEDESTGFY